MDLSVIEHKISAVLPTLSKETVTAIVAIVKECGVECVEDLQFIREDDLQTVLKPIQIRKLLSSLKMEGGDSNITVVLAETEETVTTNVTTVPAAQEAFTVDNWLDTFDLPFEKMPATVKKCLSAKERVPPQARREFVRIIADAMLEHCVNPTREHCRCIARKIVSAHTRSLGDIIDGELMGCGYTSLLNSIKNRIDNVNRCKPERRLRAPKRALQPSSSIQKDSSSSANLSHDLEVKMRDFFNSKGLKIEPWVVSAMSDTFAHQRQIVKSGATAFDLTSRYPFLCTPFFFLRHFEELTSSTIQDKAQIIAKFERLLKFFNSTSNSTSKGKVGRPLETFNPIHMPLHAIHALQAFFLEKEDTLFMMESPAHTVQDLEAKSLPPTPRLILRGNSFMDVEGWMLSIEGKVVIHADTKDDDFLKAIGCLFAAYYVFNLKYETGALATLEFLQRCIYKINDDGSSVPKKGKKTGKTEVLSRRVVTLIKDLSDFEWIH